MSTWKGSLFHSSAGCALGSLFGGQSRSVLVMSRILRRAIKGLRALAFLTLHYGELKKNRRFRNKHRGQRCFILCNGPSVLKQNLLPLRNEIVMTVSNGYLHKDFERLKPVYHFVPSVTYGMMTEQDFVRWFEEMDSKQGEAELFLGSSEHQLFKKHSLFSRRSVNYLCMATPFWPRGAGIIDICGLVPTIGSVPIMCLMVALYMGFREIYLLGTDHDSLITREYKYSFDPTVLRGKDFSVDDKGNVRVPFYVELKAYLLLWNHYRHIKKIAQSNGVKIYNATAGGMLDEFPRVELTEVLRRRSPAASVSE